MIGTERGGEDKFIYSVALQNADFGSIKSAVKVKIYQLSESRGRGVVAESEV